MVKHLTTVGLVLALLLMASTAPAVVLFTEDWEGGFNKAVWTSGTTQGDGIVDIKVDAARNHTPLGSLCLNASGLNTGQQDDWVEVVVDASATTRVIVSMWHFCDRYNNTEMADRQEIQISTDGINYTRVWGYRSGHSDDQFYPMFVRLPSWAIHATLHVRFIMNDNGNGEDYSIDDIVIGSDDPVIGDILWKIYGEFGGGSVSNLTGNAVYPNDPIIKTFLDLDGRSTTVETPTNWPRTGGT
jgi:hypothetical protein